MSKGRSLSDDERALWDAVIRAVAPLRKRKPRKREEPALVAAAPPPGKPARVAKTPAAQPKTQGPPLAPLGRRMRSKLARGSEPIDDRIDLHGMTQAEAHGALARFLRRAQAQGARVVLVITGKGAAGSVRAAGSERGVLKRQVPHWLEGAELRPLVVGFESAGIGHGGAGALYVRLRRG